MQVTITDVDGKGTLSMGTTNLSLSGNGTGTIVATGKLTDINNAIANLSYTSSKAVSGTDHITVKIDDLANGGTAITSPVVGVGGSLTDSKTITVTINQGVNAPPTLVVPTAKTVAEDTTLAVTGITVDDVDAASTSPIKVTLSVTKGTVTVGTQTGVSVVAAPTAVRP